MTRRELIDMFKAELKAELVRENRELSAAEIRELEYGDVTLLNVVDDRKCGETCCDGVLMSSNPV